jgi:hypothetical protein
LAVAVNVVLLDLHISRMPEHAFEHRRHLCTGARLQLRVVF